MCNRRTLLMLVVALNASAIAWAIPPRESTRTSRSAARPTTRATLSLGASPSLSARSTTTRGGTVNRRSSTIRPSVVSGSVALDRHRNAGRRPSNLPSHRPIIDLRPNYGPANYGSGIGSTIIGNNNIVNNTIINNNNTIINDNYGNQQFNNRRRARPYYDGLHHHWNPIGWSSYRPAYGNYYGYATSGSVVSLGGVQVGFVNPFYVRPTNVVVGLDYSQPIRVPAYDYRETNEDLVRSEQAVRLFDEARDVFRQGDYQQANDLVDAAIRLLPSDPTLHQFRGLVLFALGRYQDAAAAVYSVLAVDSGWTRDTLSKLYDDPRRYEEQFRQLQRYAADNPTAIDARFLLAYHFLMLGELNSAAKNLEVVRIARPDDRVTLNLLSAIRS
jgi:hypothetical protein